MTGAEDAARAAEAMRGVLDELADPDSELTATAATRHRLEGAAIAMESLTPAPRTAVAPARAPVSTVRCHTA